MPPLPVILLLLLLVGCGSAAPPWSNPSAETNPYQALEARFGLELRPLQPQEPRFPWWFAMAVSYTPVSSPSELLNAFSPAELEAELEKYPRDFFRDLGLRGIYWGRNVESGLFTWRLAVGGVGFNIQGERLVVLNLPEPPQAQPLPAHTLHHEIFHALDTQDESNWARCNPPNSVYGLQPSENIRREFDYPSPGFVSSYARTEAREDRAEVFALMMTNPTYAQLFTHWQISDVYLRCKQDQLVQQLQTTVTAFNREHLSWVGLGLKGEFLAQAQTNPEQVTTLQVRGYNPTGSYHPQHPDSHHPHPFILPDRIGQLLGLQTLILERTDYTELPASIASLSQLQTLTLEGQRLSSFPPALLLLKRIEHLSLRNSGLEQIPLTVFTLPQLRTLDIRENPLSEQNRQLLRHEAQARGISLQE